MCRQDGRGRFPVLLDELSKCRTNSQRKSQLRIFYMICTLNDIYKQYNKLHEHWYTKISALRCVEDRNPPQNASTCIWNTGHLQSIAGPVHASAVWTHEKTKKKTNCSYRIFIVCRSPVSPVFWARILLSYFGLSLPKQSLCTNFAITQ